MLAKAVANIKEKHGTWIPRKLKSRCCEIALVTIRVYFAHPKY